MKLFHLTPLSQLDSVLRTGLDPAHSNSSLPAIFLAGSEFTARNYEGMKNEPCIVVQVDLPQELQAHLAADNYELRDILEEMDVASLKSHGLDEGAHWQDCSWQQSLAICDEVACTALIPPECITPMRPEFVVPTQTEIAKVLKKHPLIKLDEEVERCFLVGSFAKEKLGVGKTHHSSDVDILLEVKAPEDGESAAAMEERYRAKLMTYFMKHKLKGRHDEVHPQWCGRRVDVYFTYDADLESRPKVELEAPAPKKRLRP